MSSALLHKISYQIATFLSIGRLPKMPGTWATLATIPVVMGAQALGPFFYMGLTFFLLFIGAMACEVVEAQSGDHDSGHLVIDEVVGFLITMTWLPITWQSFVFGFVFFRMLDIAKPFPISFLDRRVKGGLGVMVDDVAAGILANVVLQVIYTKTSWLGVQMVNLS
ncbi:MAG: phosphatidylglycerophosphatase A [Bdellovibrionales bacterium]